MHHLVLQPWPLCDRFKQETELGPTFLLALVGQVVADAADENLATIENATSSAARGTQEPPALASKVTGSCVEAYVVFQFLFVTVAISVGVVQA